MDVEGGSQYGERILESAEPLVLWMGMHIFCDNYS